MKERILNEAFNLIVSKGLKFTISDLASELAVSKRTIYDHFSSKDEIIESIINNIIYRIQEKETTVMIDQTLSLTEKLNELLICIPSELSVLNIRLLNELKQYHYKQWNILDEFLSESWTNVIEVINEGKKQGVFKDINVSLFIELYLGVMARIQEQHFLSKQDFSFKEALEGISDILLHGIKNN